MGISEFADIQLHYQQLDAAPGSHRDELILIHGFACSLGIWYFTIAPALTQFGRVTMIDLRGHGRSSMPLTGYQLSDFVADLDRVLGLLGIEQAHIVGHSLGGAIATAYALTYPERTRSLILADARLKPFQPVVKAQDFSLWVEHRQLLKTQLGIEIDADCPEQSYDFLIKLISARLHLPEPQFSQILQNEAFAGLAAFAKLRPRTAHQVLKLVNTTTFLQDLRADSTFSIESLQALDLPTLAVYGENSHTLPTGIGLQTLWPNLKFKQVPAAGHFFPISHPTTLIDPMVEFLRFQHQSTTSGNPSLTVEPLAPVRGV
jgi:pimeloyl-ACP methyl ester carboxylesterase